MTNIERIKVLKEIRDKNLGVAEEDLGFERHFTNREMEALNWAIKVCHRYESQRASKKIGGEIMMCDFNAEFHPTPEQVQEQERFFKQIVEKAYKEKQCITCKHCIPIDPDLPGFVIAFPTCKVTDNIANKTCDKYESDKVEGEE